MMMIRVYVVGDTQLDHELHLVHIRVH